LSPASVARGDTKTRPGTKSENPQLLTLVDRKVAALSLIKVGGHLQFV